VFGVDGFRKAHDLIVVAQWNVNANRFSSHAVFPFTMFLNYQAQPATVGSSNRPVAR
jgi:hypothetical protein